LSEPCKEVYDPYIKEIFLHRSLAILIPNSLSLYCIFILFHLIQGD